MSCIVGVINYGVAGNTHSVKKALEKAGAKVLIINTLIDFEKVDKIVIPGVGSFHDAMNELNREGFIEALQGCKKSILGICLGMQVLSKLGYEYGKTEGLGMIDAEVKGVLCNAKVPHMGFNSIHVVRPNALFKGIEDEEFYFMHSFEVVNYTDVASLTTYAGHTFVSSIKKNDIYGVQFHPEKSREPGISLFKNFIAL